MVEGGGLENRITSNRDGGSNPSPSAIPVPRRLSPGVLTEACKKGRMALLTDNMRRGAGVAEQGRLLSDCADKIGTVGSNPTLSAI